MMAPKFVVPYRMSGKRGMNDSAVPAAICETDIPFFLSLDKRMEPSARVFHQGPLRAMQPRMTVCSFAVHMSWTEQATTEIAPRCREKNESGFVVNRCAIHPRWIAV
jgi:hypothetical protein